MEPETPPSTPRFESGCPTGQGSTVTKVSEPIPYSSWDAPWTLVSVPASEIESDASQWHREQSDGTLYIIGKYNNDAYEVIIDPAYLPGLKFRRLELDLAYNPTQPGERQKAVYGTYRATKDARAPWLRHAAHKIRSEQHPEIKSAYRHFARFNGLHEALARAILIYDILTSTAPVQRTLVQNLLVLFLNLEGNYYSYEAHKFFESTQGELLDILEVFFSVSVSAKEPRHEAHTISLGRAFLELSGGGVDLRQHGFAEEYTASDNADIYAELLGIKRTRQFGDFDPEEMYDTLLRSPVFSGMEIGLQELGVWTTKMMESLHIGFRKGYLDLPSQVLGGFGFGQVQTFNAYRAYTYHTIPPLEKPRNNTLLLLTWSTVVSDRQRDVLREWANSEAGRSLYEQLAREVQDSQSVEQLALNMAALMNYRRLLPDVLDCSDQPIKGSYLADLDALFHGQPLGNSGRVAEQMVFALLRVLYSFADDFENLTTFLETALDREPPPLHLFDGFSDQYLRLMINGQPHEAARVDLSRIKIPELRGEDDPDWVNVTHPKEFSLQDHSQRAYSDCILPAMEIENSMEESQGSRG